VSKNIPLTVGDVFLALGVGIVCAIVVPIILFDFLAYQQIKKKISGFFRSRAVA